MMSNKTQTEMEKLIWATEFTNEFRREQEFLLGNRRTMVGWGQAVNGYACGIPEPQGQ